MVRAGTRSGRLLKRFKARIDLPVAAILIVNTIAHTIGASVAGASYANVFAAETLWIFAILFTLAVLLFTEIIPKTLGVTYASRLAAPVAFGIQSLIVVLKPLVLISEKISTALRGSRRPPVTSIEEIRLLAALGRSEGVVGQRTASIIMAASELRELRAADIMLPHDRVRYLSGRWDRERVLDSVRRDRHSRYPYTPSESLDDAQGFVLTKELMLQLEQGVAAVDWSTLIHEPLVVPESQTLNRLLRVFQEARSHLAFVVDEFGHFVGIVTLEDVLEQIVGDIIDESDLRPRAPRRAADGSLEVEAGMALRSLSETLGLDFKPSRRAHSVNGLLTERLGRLPVVGDNIHWRGFEFHVLSISERRAERVLVRTRPAGGLDPPDPPLD
jgi:CBS domain containing-hemolysin-like protein